MIVPTSLPTLLGLGYDQIISEILQNPDNHLQNIVNLSKMCKVKLTFKRPVEVVLSRRKVLKDITEYTFSKFFVRGGMYLYYMLKSNGRYGYPISYDLIDSYEPVIKSLDRFDTFEQFRKKFDTLFITEEAIKKLWEGTSAQHGEKYKPSDFKSIGPQGKMALRLFLSKFNGVSSTDRSPYTERKHIVLGTTYFDRSCCSYGTGRSKTSRDVTVSHALGRNTVSYSSEYAGTGNGTYGIIANKNTYLWLEND